jgi:hypothetical protein
MKFEIVTMKDSGYRTPYKTDRKIYCVKVDPSLSLHEFNQVHDWCWDTFGTMGAWYEDIHGLNFYREEDLFLFVLRWS